MVDETEKRDFKKKLAESVVYKELYDYVFGLLCKNYSVEEEAFRKIIKNLKSNSQFNPKDYGQEKALVECKFTTTGQLLASMNNLKTPFEKVHVLKQVHKQIKAEIDTHLLSKGQHGIALNEDIIVASLTTAFVNAQVDHPIANMFILQSFCHVDYGISEVGNFHLILIMANF